MIIIIIILLIIFFIVFNNQKIMSNTSKIIRKREENNIYVINLDRDEKRLKLFMKNNNITFNRFKAINGNELNIEELKERGILKLDDKSFKFSKHRFKDTYKGSLGCALSHINLWKSLKYGLNDYYIIFEDDCVLKSNFNENVLFYLNSLPENWDILFLGGSRIYGKKIKNLIKAEYSNSWMNCGLFAYIIRRRSINKLLEISLPINTYIDMQINKEYGKKINAYYTNKPLVNHDYTQGSTRDLYKNKYDEKFKRDANKVIII